MAGKKKIRLDFGGISENDVGEMAVGTLKEGGFVFPPPPEPSPPPVSPDEARAQGWMLMNSASTVSRVTNYPTSALRMTEVFNFATLTCHEICEELQKGRSHASAISFADVDKARLDEAAGALKNLGGVVP